MNNIDQKKVVDKSGDISLKELILKIKRWWKYLLSKWVIILFAGIVGGAIGLTYALVKKPVYKAELSFALEDDKSSGGGLSGALGLASQFGFDLSSSGGGAFSGDNLLELMKSRSMVENTLLTTVNINGKNQTLAELYISFNKLRESKPEFKGVRFLPGADPAKFTLKQDSILGVFYREIVKNSLSVEKIDKKLSIITVVVNSKNELFSKYFTEVLTKTVSDFYIDTKTKKSVKNVAILQHQTDSVRRELNAALIGVAASADVNPNANPSLQILRVPSQRRQVDVQANQAILTQLVANLELSKVSLRKETPLIQIIDRPILPLEKDKVGRIKGFIMGGMSCAFLVIIILFCKKVFKDIMLENPEKQD
ncbi:MAG: lipopolysaccharide biosynthesis protein [Mucilaginibacter sp.]